MVPESPISADPDSRIPRGAGVNSLAGHAPETTEDPILSDFRQRYGLSADPFCDDQEFPLFTGAQRRELLDQLLHLCQFGNSVLVVLGDVGVGKTRMANALLDSMADTDEACLIDAQPEQTAENLLSQIAHAFGLRRDGAESTGQLLAALRGFSQPVMGSGDLALVVIDNAHNLDDQTLAALLSLLQGREGDNRRLHLVFFAELSLIGRLDQLDMQDVLINDFYLERFTLSETVDYLNFRMEMADYLGPEIFNEVLVEPWWGHAQGQLPVLHDYARDCLLKSVLPPLTSAGKPFPILHIVAAALLGAIFLMTFFYSADDKKERSSSVVSQSVPINGQPLTAVPMVEGSSTPASSLAAEVVPVLSEEPASASTTEIPISSPGGDPVASGVNEVQSLSPSTLTENAADSSVAVVATPAEIPQASAQTSAPVIQEPKQRAAPARKPIQLSEDEQILMSWRTTEFTLQLLGVSSERAARDFIASQSNRDDLLMFKSKRQGRDWFVVVAGRYASASSARDAVDNLPSGQRKAGPWPRNLKAIQEEIVAVRDL